MKGSSLGEFEELVVLTVGVLYPNAYGVALKNEIKKRTGRNTTLSGVHIVLSRLEKKGFLASKFGNATRERGGKPKKFFIITKIGSKALIEAREIRSELWKEIPEIALQATK